MTDQQPAPDPAFLAFLRARLVEEREAATARSNDDAGPPGRGVGLLEEILSGLDRGEAPDQMSRDLLVVAYAHHPGFRLEWNRWRSGPADDLTRSGWTGAHARANRRTVTRITSLR